MCGGTALTGCWVLGTDFLANSGLALGTCPDLVSPWLLRQQFFQALTSAEALHLAAGWGFPSEELSSCPHCCNSVFPAFPCSGGCSEAPQAQASPAPAVGSAKVPPWVPRPLDSP